jgi:hypothetical protein
MEPQSAAIGFRALPKIEVGVILYLLLGNTVRSSAVPAVCIQSCDPGCRPEGYTTEDERQMCGCRGLSGCMLVRIFCTTMPHPCLLQKRLPHRTVCWSAFYLCTGLCRWATGRYVLQVCNSSLGMVDVPGLALASSFLLVDQLSLFAGRLFAHGTVGHFTLNDHTCSFDSKQLLLHYINRQLKNPPSFLNPVADCEACADEKLKVYSYMLILAEASVANVFMMYGKIRNHEG